MQPIHGGDPLGSILGPMGSHWGQRNVSNHKKLPCPKIRFFLLLRGQRFGQKIDLTGLAPNHAGDPLGFILGPMGSHWGQKWVKTVKNYLSQKILIFYYSAVIDLGKKSNLRLWRQITLGNPWGPSWGRWGPIGAKKWVKTVKNCHAPKFEFLNTPGSSIWAKNRIYGYDAISRWGPPRSILGPMGSHWGQKMGQNRKKLPSPQTTPRSSIWAKNRIYGYDAKSRWGPPRSILGPMGSHWGQKMGQNRKKLPCPKIRILTTPRSSIWPKNQIYGYGAKSQ